MADDVAPVQQNLKTSGLPSTEVNCLEQTNVCSTFAYSEELNTS